MTDEHITDAPSSAKLLKRYSRKPLFEPGSLPPASYSREDVQELIPHRDPFLLIDRIEGFDPREARISGSRFLSPDDPVFKGHFPQKALFPGVLQVEAAGQLGLCMHALIQRESGETPAGLNALASRILGAVYLAPLSPRQTVTVLAQKLYHDDFKGVLIGQVLSEEKRICSVSIGEVAFL